MDNIVVTILDYFKSYKLNFDVYIIADTQERTKYLYNSKFQHADENEFFSKEEFSEIASAIFFVFGYVRVFYSEMEFIEYFIKKKLNTDEFIVYNFARDGLINGKKSLIPAFCDLLHIRYTGSNAFVISLLRNKDIYTCLLEMNGIPVPKSKIYRVEDGCTDIISQFLDQKVIVKNLYESASIGLNEHSVFTVTDDSEHLFSDITSHMGHNSLLIQEFIDGPEFEILVLQFKGIYYSLYPVEIVFSNSYTYIDSKISNAYQYQFRIAAPETASILCHTAIKAASILNIQDYARFDFRIRNGTPYLIDIAGTPYTIYHSSIAYLFTEYYHLPYESIYKTVVACMLSNYELNC